MKYISNEEMKSIQISMLKDLHGFCEKNNIDYFLCGGSLLGAVRHKGMIPWDDDIDVAMTRDNYNKFLECYSSQTYKLHKFSKDGNYLLPFAKISHPGTVLNEVTNVGEDIGINIDLFPVDGLPEGDGKAIRFVKQMKNLWGLIVCATVTEWSKRSKLKKFEIVTIKTFYRLFPIQKQIVAFTNKYAQKYSFENAEKAAVVVWGYGLKEIVDKKSFTPTILVPFEDFEVRIPINYDIYLKSLYGNYMQLPPEEQRVRKHGAEVYWR